MAMNAKIPRITLGKNGNSPVPENPEPPANDAHEPCDLTQAEHLEVIEGLSKLILNETVNVIHIIACLVLKGEADWELINKHLGGLFGITTAAEARDFFLKGVGFPGHEYH